MRLRFSIMGLMALVLFVAVGFAALRNPTELWAYALFTLALGIFGIAALGAAFRQGYGRAFFAGFAAFGFGYLILCYGPWAATEVRPHLATAKLLEYAPPWLNTTNPMVPFPRGSIAVVDVEEDQGSAFITYSNLTLLKPSPEAYQRVGHSLFALVIALIGGTASRYFAARDDQPIPRPS